MDQQIYNYLLKTAKSNNHLKLYKIIQTLGFINLPSSRLTFRHYLVRTIVGQQISTKAAESIWKKVEIVLKSKQKISKKNLFLSLRECGLSERKANYSIAILMDETIQKLSKKKLLLMDLDEYKHMLTSFHGVGPWTVEMSRIFYLGDEDILSEGDYGIQVAHNRIFPLEKISKDFYQRYSPFRSYICLYLWRSLNLDI